MACAERARRAYAHSWVLGVPVSAGLWLLDLFALSLDAVA